jgi:hypothetical protein
MIYFALCEEQQTKLSKEWTWSHIILFEQNGRLLNLNLLVILRCPRLLNTKKELAEKVVHALKGGWY